MSAAFPSDDDESVVANSVDSDCTFCPSPSILEGLSSLGLAKSRLLQQHSELDKTSTTGVAISQKKNSFDYETSSEISEPLVPTSILQNINGSNKNKSSYGSTRYIGFSKSRDTSPEFPHLPKLRKLTEYQNDEKIVGYSSKLKSLSENKQDSADTIHTKVSEDDKIGSDSVSTEITRKNKDTNIPVCERVNVTESPIHELGNKIGIENPKPDVNSKEVQIELNREATSVNNSQNEANLTNDVTGSYGVQETGMSRSAGDKLMDVQKQQGYVCQLLQIGQSTEMLKAEMNSLQVNLKLLGEANKKEKSEIMQRQGEVVSAEGRMELKRRLVTLASRHRTLINLLLKQKQLAAKFQMIYDKSQNQMIDGTAGQSQCDAEKLQKEEHRKKNNVPTGLTAIGKKDFLDTGENTSEIGMVTTNTSTKIARKTVQRTSSLEEKDSVTSTKKIDLNNSTADTVASQMVPDRAVPSVRMSSAIEVNVGKEVHQTVYKTPKEQYFTINPESGRVLPLQPGSKILVSSGQKNCPVTSKHASQTTVNQNSTALPSYQVRKCKPISDVLTSTADDRPQVHHNVSTGGCMLDSQSAAESHENSQMNTDAGTSKVKKPVSLRSLIEQNVIQPGKDVLSFINQEETFVANLMQSGVIQDSSGECFCNPSQWFKSATGKKRVSRSTTWAKVKYKGHPLNGFTLPAVTPVSHQDGNNQLSTANGMSCSGNSPELTEGNSTPTSSDLTLNMEQHLTRIFHNYRINLISNNELFNWHGILPEDFWQKSDFQIPEEWMDEIEFQ